MNTAGLKETINNKTGIPLELLAGETEQEIIAHAKELLLFKADAEQKQPAKQSTAEQFAQWISGAGCNPDQAEQNKAINDLDNIAESLQGYPALADQQTQYIENENEIAGATTQEKFTNWMKATTSFNPFRQ